MRDYALLRVICISVALNCKVWGFVNSGTTLSFSTIKHSKILPQAKPVSFCERTPKNLVSNPMRATKLQMSSSNDGKKSNPFNSPLSRRLLFISTSLAAAQFYFAQAYAPSEFQRIPTQFIAALGDPNAKSGSNAQEWGLWTVDPGPRGVFLDQYESKLVDRNGVAPAGWKFNKEDWWLEEHGLIMEAPTFPVPPGKYLVTGGRMVTTTLTIEPPDESTGKQSWSLEDGKLYDVTHLPCRSARYHPQASTSSGLEAGSPATANKRDFPVKPGAEMPNVIGCDKQDYAVIFLIGKANIGKSVA